MLHALLDRLFGKAEEINGANRCPTYLFRWRLLTLGRWKLYLHKFVGDDWSLDMHDHPKRFVSVGLWGGYTELTPGVLSGTHRERVYSAPWLRTFPADHVHRIVLAPYRRCWTLVLVLGSVREWGFWHGGQWLSWKEYVRSAAADAMKSCP